MKKDPPKAALVLLEVKKPDETAFATDRMREVLGQRIAICEFKEHTNMVLDASFSPSGDLVVTASSDGTARIWSLYASDLQKAIKDATNICLDPEFRERSLGESWEEATRKYEQCEREHGRNP